LLIPLQLSHETYIRDTKTETASTTPVVQESIPQDLRKIADCESGNNQFDKEGNVIVGRVNPKDIGVLQINSYYWGETAKELGYDIYTRGGNLSMGLWLYKNYGTQPWQWSKSCWNK